MDSNPRARCWIATVPWPDAEFPTSTVIPDIGQVKAHAKFSRENDSVSIWFTFVNAVRSSTVTTAFNTDVVVRSARSADSSSAFESLPFDWEWRFLSDTLDTVPCQPAKMDVTHVPDSTHAPRPIHTRSPVGAPSSPASMLAHSAKEISRIRKRINELDEELGVHIKRAKDCVAQLD